ncbi:FeoA family protein [Actinomyces viscosus]|uniref:FeoA family protein n=1 Tax=Actinomyces viscosus TaxID=1656 RepID=UPI0028E59963|nr:FeoA family protein [Actinomyces viscosus]
MTTAVSSHGTSASTGTIDTPDTPDTPPPAGRSLSDLHLGTSGRVVGLLEDAASGPIIKRLSNLGFVPGRVVTPLRRAPLGDPVVYRVADYELCLRHHEARIVRVEAVTEADDGVESVSEAVTDSEDEGQRR